MTHYQDDLFGHRMALGTIMDRIRYLMEGDEGCRNDDMEMLAQLWFQDGLDHVLPPEFHEPFTSFLVSKATNAKTALNRRQDLQRLHAHLAPSADVAEKRGQGGGHAQD